MKELACEPCWTNVFNTEAIEKFWTGQSHDFSYSATWEQVSQSAQKGCVWCCFFQDVLPSPQTSGWPSAWTTTKILLIVLEKAWLTSNTSPEGLNQCQIDFYSEGSMDWHIEFDMFIDSPKDPAAPVTARPLQTDVSSPGAYLQIEQWLDDCCRHGDCGKVSSDVALPSRLLEVSPQDAPAVARLRSTSEEKGSYLALSYCWGSEQTYMLTSENVELLMRGLEEHLLPQTIRDAIAVTRTLGFQYLWVDALCIMQDSGNPAAQFDMDKELARMHDVYGNAIMTIAASCASSVTEGFLYDRFAPKHKVYDIPIRLRAGHFITSRIKEHLNYDDMQEPLNTRAWTFQEQMLSPRLLIYASHTLQWQCRTLTCNLGGSYHSPRPSAAPRLRLPEMLLPKKPVESDDVRRPEHDIPHAILQPWLEIIKRSSMRKSSLPSDKLPVVSALASSYTPIFGTDYYAGIWAKSPVHQLCWRNPNSSRCSFTRPKEYRAPSWSWASVDGQLYFPSFLEIGGKSAITPNRDFKVIQWLTSLKSVDLPFGEVTGGNLAVRAASRDATFQTFSSPTLTFDTGSWTGIEQIQYTHGIADVLEDNFGRSIRCVAMYHQQNNEVQQIGGLMLVKLLEDNDIYRRIGVFTADAREFDDCPTSLVNIA